MLVLVPLLGCAAGACWLAAHGSVAPTVALALLAALLMRVTGGFSARTAWRASRSRAARHVVVYLPVRICALAWLGAGALIARGSESASPVVGALACAWTALLHLLFVAKEDAWDL